MSRLPPEAFALLALLGFACLSAMLALGFACLSAMLALCAAPLH